MNLATRTTISLLALSALAFPASQARAWGNEGHEVVALIAEHYLEATPAVLAEVRDLLADADTGYTGYRALPKAATWADYFRSNGGIRTRQWHFVDIDYTKHDLDAACFDYPAIPRGQLAFDGVNQDCVVNKIMEFKAELADRSLPRKERQMALLFLLHLVGDIHQPLHSAERNGDGGGNAVPVVVGTNRYGTGLHGYWDTNAVTRLGSTPELIAASLISDLGVDPKGSWRNESDPKAWALEGYRIAVDYAYDPLPSSTRPCLISHRNAPTTTEQCHIVSSTYAIAATGKVRGQLEKSGVRLADLLVEALKTP